MNELPPLNAMNACARVAQTGSYAEAARTMRPDRSSWAGSAGSRAWATNGLKRRPLKRPLRMAALNDQVIPLYKCRQTGKALKTDQPGVIGPASQPPFQSNTLEIPPHNWRATAGLYRAHSRSMGQKQADQL